MDKKDLVNILVVSSKYPPEYAGSGLRAHNTYKRFSRKYNFRYSVLCGSVMYNQTRRYSFEGISVYRIACKLFKVKDTEEIKRKELFKKITRKFKNGLNYLIEAYFTWLYLFRYGSKFDLIHIFGNNYVTAAALTYARLTKKPLILEICNVSPNFRLYEPVPIRKIWGRKLQGCSKVVCISKRIKEICLLRGYADDDRIWCRPNPIETAKFFIDKENKLIYRKALNLFDDRDIVLINIGKICPLKNQIFLIDVLKRLPDRYKLVIAGPLVDRGPYLEEDTSYFNKIKAKIKDCGLDGRVKIEKGFIDNVDKYMKAADVYLLPSQIEACATPVLETLACGIPVVAHSIKGVTEKWIKDGINGYLSSLDEELFAKKVRMALTLDKERLEKESLEMVRQTSTDFIDEKYNNLVRELLDR